MLKTNNYVVKSYNLTLPTAYAAVRDVDTRLERTSARIGIFKSREDALNPAVKPFEAITVVFDTARDSDKNVHTLAYEAAKKAVVAVQKYDPETGAPINMGEKRIFEDWTDDIVDIVKAAESVEV